MFPSQHHRTEPKQQEGWRFKNLINKAVGRKNQGKSAKRAGIQKTKSKILKKFSPFLTPYFTTSYALHYPLYAICYTLFFRPNAHLRPIVERRSFSAPRGTGVPPVKTRPRWPCYFGLLGVLFWTFIRRRRI